MRYHPCSVNPTEARFTDLAKHPTDSRGSGSIVPGPEGDLKAWDERSEVRLRATVVSGGFRSLVVLGQQH